MSYWMKYRSKKNPATYNAELCLFHQDGRDLGLFNSTGWSVREKLYESSWRVNFPFRNIFGQLLEHHFGSFIDYHTRHHNFVWFRGKSKHSRGPCEISCIIHCYPVYRGKEQKPFNELKIEKKKKKGQ